MTIGQWQGGIIMLIFKENLPAYRIGHEKYAKYVEMPYGDVEDARQAVLHYFLVDPGKSNIMRIL